MCVCFVILVLNLLVNVILSRVIPITNWILNVESFIDGSVQDCSSPIANALVLLQSCVKPSISKKLYTWWRHQMETFSALLAICAGNSPHKGQWHGALIFSLICAWINDWVSNGEAGDFIRYRIHYDVTLMIWLCCVLFCCGTIIILSESMWFIYPHSSVLLHR